MVINYAWQVWTAVPLIGYARVLDGFLYQERFYYIDFYGDIKSMNAISKQVAHLSTTMDYLSQCYMVESAGALLGIQD